LQNLSSKKWHAQWMIRMLKYRNKLLDIG
jgi:hypothetical protein